MISVGIDTEGTGLYPYGTIDDWGFAPARPFAFIFCTDKGDETYIEWEVNPKTREVVRGSKGDVRVIRDVLEDERIRKIFFNKSYDARMLKFAGFKLRGLCEDAMVAAHVATGGARMSYGLKQLCKELGFPDDDEKELKRLVNDHRREAKKRGWCVAEKGGMFGREPWKADMWLPFSPVRKACKRYARGDGQRTVLLWETVKKSLIENSQMRETYERELRLMPAISRMEERGVWMSRQTALWLKDVHYKNYMEEQRRVAAAEGYPDLNFNSAPQKQRVFFQDRGHAPINFTGKGAAKTDAETMHALSAVDPLAKAVLEYGVASKTISNFLAKYIAFSYADPETGGHRIHTNIRQIGPVTGRMASSDPNLMNVASEDTGRNWADEGPRVRECFGPRPGHLWLMPDYSQVEVWIFAFQSGDPDLTKALLTGQDFHAFVAKQVWGRERDFKKRAKYYRKRAKLIMFCKLYGGGAKKVAMLLRSSLEEAYRFVADFDKRFPGINRHSSRTIRRARRAGFMVNNFGRHYMVEPGYEYRMVNYLVQGTAADIFKEAIIGVDHLFQSKWRGCRILIPYHDELICEVPTNLFCEELVRDVVLQMQQPSKRAGIPVPLPVEAKIAEHRWHKTRKVELKWPSDVPSSVTKFAA